MGSTMQPMDWAGVPYALIAEVEPYLDAVGRTEQEVSLFRGLIADGEFDAAFASLIAIAAFEDVSLPADLLDRIEAVVADADEEAFIDEFGEDLRRLRLIAV